MIPQEPHLLHRTIACNIRYGRPSATMREVVAVAKKVQCDEFIRQLPQGYNTIVGTQGSKLSGGQRQRIAIARALLKESKIILLDEATSALDSVTETAIQESLRSLRNGRTMVVVAHRIFTLTEMDRIFVFDNGKIIEEGSYQELLDKKEHFAHLHSLQVNGFIPE